MINGDFVADDAAVGRYQNYLPLIASAEEAIVPVAPNSLMLHFVEGGCE